jgi:hypothetical protein
VAFVILLHLSIFCANLPAIDARLAPEDCVFGDNELITGDEARRLSGRAADEI